MALERTGTPLISVIILNYNGARWMERCLASLQEQTWFEHIEVIIADNHSTDGSDQLCERLLEGWSNGRFVQNGANLGFCEGNNRGAALARGKFLFFLNNDTWLERDCLEMLMREVDRCHALAATPAMLNYEDDSPQSYGGAGFDCFGFLSIGRPVPGTRDIFVCGGCCFLIRHDLFEKLGRFDTVFFMYADEYDLSWRVWVSGARAILVPAARLHHRGAPNVNPKGGGAVVEIVTTEFKRYYSNRNNLLVLLKNAEHLLLLLVVLQIFFLALESLVWLLLIRRWSFVKNAYWGAVQDCWRLRGYIEVERRKVREFRRRGDFWLLRFLRFRLNRWDDFLRFRQLGMPQVKAE